jgi:hypothetical protein
MAIQKNGYVALFDVLGFSDRVMRGAFNALDGYIDTVVRTTAPHDDLGTVLFSDTVVVFSFNDSESSFRSIIDVSSSLLWELLHENVPVRGAISHGSFSRSENEAHGTVIAGRPIIDAHHYESRLQWIGIMLTPSLLEHRAEISASGCAMAPPRDGLTADEVFAHVRRRATVQPCSSIPLEDPRGVATRLEGFAVVPLSTAATSFKRSGTR